MSPELSFLIGQKKISIPPWMNHAHLITIGWCVWQRHPLHGIHFLWIECHRYYYYIVVSSRHLENHKQLYMVRCSTSHGQTVNNVLPAGLLSHSTLHSCFFVLVSVFDVSIKKGGNILRRSTKAPPRRHGYCLEIIRW